MATATEISEEQKEKESIQQEDDIIPGTVFSKCWILSLLVKLVSTVEETPTGGGRDVVSSSLEEENSEKEGEEKDDLDEKIENDLCLLWDVTVTKEVAVFLYDHHILDLIIGVLTRSRYVRLTEICLGILNNMTCYQSLLLEDQRNEAFSSHNLITTLVSLLYHWDTTVLIELTKLIVTCLSHDQVGQHWLEEFNISDTVLPHLTFILSSSTNCNLLSNVSNLVDILLDKSPVVLKKWSQSTELLQGLCEAFDECYKCNRSDVMCTLMMSIQSLSTIEEGFVSILNCSSQVYPRLVNFLHLSSSFTCNQQLYPKEVRQGGLMAVLSLCHFILTNHPVEGKDLKDMLFKDDNIIKFLRHLLITDSEEEEEQDRLKTIKELTSKLLSL